MKLLLDQNLSFKLCERLKDVFPGSTQVRLAGLAQANDSVLWEHAKQNGFAIVTGRGLRRISELARATSQSDLVAMWKSKDCFHRELAAQQRKADCRVRDGSSRPVS